MPKPSGIDSLRWKPDEPDAKSRGNMQRTLRAPNGLQYRPRPHIRFHKEFQTVLDQISPRAHTEVLTLMIKQQKENLAADNEVIQAQQQLLQDLYRDQQSSLETTNHAANRARPRPRPPKTAPKTVQQTYNLASMQAQLSELQKMFCKISEAVNVNKELNSILVCLFLTQRVSEKVDVLKGSDY